ncbi:Uncharacterized protein HZ326_6971 [Fusarium oxysporum f. sp. albedinis]|nr:Uncharacterized protein HZ326_6971 [Fusarium oxysporum f. sp. albedinis]
MVPCRTCSSSPSNMSACFIFVDSGYDTPFRKPDTSPLVLKSWPDLMIMRSLLTMLVAFSHVMSISHRWRNPPGYMWQGGMMEDLK